MNINDMREIIKTKEYDVLRTNKDLSAPILFTAGGSYSYGTNIETSDFDLRGVTNDIPENLLGTKHFDDFVNINDTVDIAIYGLNKYITLLCKCNPTAIELLGVEENKYIFLSDEGKMLRDNVSLFLTQKAIYSFGGFAVAQLRRLENALARDSYPQVDKEKHIMESIKANIEYLTETYGNVASNFNIYMDDSNKGNMDKEIYIDIDMKHYPLRDFANTIQNMNQVIRNFDKVGHRNHKKDDTHLYKHAMHLIRLQKTLYYILHDGVILTKLPDNDIKLLMQIRKEQVSFDDVFKMNLELNDINSHLIKTNKLPKNPDMKKVDKLVYDIHMSQF